MNKHEHAVQWLIANRPGSEWALTGTEYTDFKWFGDPALKPTAEELGF